MGSVLILTGGARTPSGPLVIPKLITASLANPSRSESPVPEGLGTIGQTTQLPSSTTPEAKPLITSRCGPLLVGLASPRPTPSLQS